ncbi:PHP domain-like protein [Neolentinus lepideus HHB14362 ss-1]|uniref:PHP domain-like protein n=1 Tax=Neolentinus lepideus HHB14362 ss-1 TaxID=1314782 RepID=A0A165SQV3_9AGAM|nr:PHP domain-like protein [Neolentinus lepideus HHB14362 ss-1]
MFFDLNVPIPGPPFNRQNQLNKGKGKLPMVPVAVSYPATQIAAIEHRIDLLVHLGYSVIAFNQTVQKKIDPKTHINILDPLLLQLRKRTDVVYLKRLTIILDDESEKGFGLTNNHQPLVAPYDILALTPTTSGSFSVACLTHTLPSPLTTHIISLPLSLPRLPFHLKHTIVRTAIKNGAVFEINYAGALGAEDGGEAGKRNWWAGARELVRVTKGKGVLVSGGINAEWDLRAPRDVANLTTLLGLPQDVAHHAATTIPKSLVVKAQTRRTYRAILSEPKIVIPQQAVQPAAVPPIQADTPIVPAVSDTLPATEVTPSSESVPATNQPAAGSAGSGNSRKRALDTGDKGAVPSGEGDGSERKKKKKKKNKEKGESAS